MQKFRILLMSALALMMMTGSVWAFSADDHVKVAPNGKGTSVIYPFYSAFQGTQTKMTLVNTSDSYSQVVKFVVRSHADSEELRDFLVYLSPTDVWTGYIVYDSEDGAKIVSYDDSVMRAGSQWADEDNPMEINLLKPENEDNVYSNWLGYAVAIQAWTTDMVYDGEDLGSAPVPKQSIYEAYKNAFTIPHNQNILASSMDLTINDMTTSVNPVVLADYKIVNKLNLANETSFMGYNSGAQNSIAEVEAALAKDDIAMSYMNSDEGITLEFMTFSTKEEELRISENIGVPSPYFLANGGSSNCTEYRLVTYDTEENDSTNDTSVIFSPVSKETPNSLCNEVQFLDVASNSPFDEGWMRFTFNDVTDSATTGEGMSDGNDLRFTGAPVIPMSLDMFADGSLSLKYAAWTDGEVRSTSSNPTNPELPYYQYAD